VEFLDFTSVMLDEFQQLVPPFEAAFHAHMAAWRLDGKPRTARQFAVYKNCPLPTPGDRLFFILGRCFTSGDLVLDRVSQRQSNGGRGRLVVSASSTSPQGPTSTPVKHPHQLSEKTYARVSRA
jgi:hypothetical protein